LKRTIWASVTVGLAALMTFGCGNVFDSSNGTNENNSVQFTPNQNASNPFKIWAVDTAGQLFSFPSDNPSFVTAPVAITGTNGGERIIAIDCRPRTGVLYGLGVSGRLYFINKGTGAATLVGTGAAPGQINADIDFNPVVDRVRQEAGVQNVRLNPGTAVASVDTALTIQPGGAAANSVACAYTNPEEAPNDTQLFVISATTSRVYRQGNPNPNDGVLTEVGVLPFEIGSNVGFDFAPGNVGFASVQKINESFSTFVKVDPASGAATAESRIGSANPVKSIAVDLSGPTLKRFVGIDAGNNLVRFNSDNPNNLISSTAITAGDGNPFTGVVVGCDFSAGGTQASGLKVLTVPSAGGPGRVYSVDLAPGANFAKTTLVSVTPTNLPDPVANQYGIDILPGTNNLIATAAAGSFTGRRILSGGSTQVFAINMLSGAVTPLPSYVGYVPALGFDTNFVGSGSVFGFGINLGQPQGSEVPFTELVGLSSTGIQNTLGFLGQPTTETCELDIGADDSMWFVGRRYELRTAAEGNATQPFPVDDFSTLFQVSRPALGGVPVGRIGGGPLKHFTIIPALEQNPAPNPRLTEAP
jgi:hypothetical protein